MTERKANNHYGRIVKAINSLIEDGITDTKEIADILQKNQRTVQAYLDLTDSRKMPSGDVAYLARYFMRLGSFEIALCFITETHQIEPLEIGKAIGTTDRITKRLIRATGILNDADGDIDKLETALQEMRYALADLRAEAALLKLRLRDEQ